jgi:hypothetical protein
VSPFSTINPSDQEYNIKILAAMNEPIGEDAGG